MFDKDFIAEMVRKMEEAKKKRPDIPSEDLLVSISGNDTTPKSVKEFNDSGELMVFACGRREDLPLKYVVFGSTWKNCYYCKQVVWMSPATEETMKKVKNSRIICMQCIPNSKELRDSKDETAV